MRTPAPDPAATRRDDLRTLGLLSTASAQDILQAYLRLRRALRADSPALRSAASDEERRDMLQRVEEAYLRLCAQAGQPLRPDVRAGQHPERRSPTYPAARPVGARGPATGAPSWHPPSVHPGSRGAIPSSSGPATPPTGEMTGEPRPDVRSRPSPFRARPSLPLS